MRQERGEQGRARSEGKGQNLVVFATNQLEQITTAFILQAVNEFRPLADVTTASFESGVEHAEGRQTHRVGVRQVLRI